MNCFLYVNKPNNYRMNRINRTKLLTFVLEFLSFTFTFTISLIFAVILDFIVGIFTVVVHT